ncbi:unnamed protein product, partial [Rotaria sp. Silwood1]
MEKQHIRLYIKTRWLLGLTATQIHDKLTTAYGQGVVSYCTVTRWIQRFSNEQESFEDNPRSGRPITAITQQNIDAVKDLVNDDPHISIDYIAAILDISHGSVDAILKQHLGLRKITSKWVPHKLTQEQRQRRIDICIENLQKLESGIWRLCDIVTGDETWIYHRKIKSKEQSKAWVTKDESPPTQKRPLSTTNGIKLHHDNARPHMNNIVFNYLQEEKVKIMAHPPYSPDLAPSDFWLFNCLKRNLDTYPDATSLAT